MIPRIRYVGSNFTDGRFGDFSENGWWYRNRGGWYRVRRGYGGNGNSGSYEGYIDSGMDPMKENLVGSVTIILVVWKTLIEERGESATVGT